MNGNPSLVFSEEFINFAFLHLFFINDTLLAIGSTKSSFITIIDLENHMEYSKLELSHTIAGAAGCSMNNGCIVIFTMLQSEEVRSSLLSTTFQCN